MLALSEADADKTVAVAAGDTIEIQLPENATAGYRWTLETIDKSVCEVIADERALGFAYRFFDRMELLGDVEARPAGLNHPGDCAQVPLAALEAPDDGRVGSVAMVLGHEEQSYPSGGDIPNRRRA